MINRLNANGKRTKSHLCRNRRRQNQQLYQDQLR